MDDVEVSEVSLEDLRTIAKELMQREDCAQEVQKYLEAGDYVCQGQQVLKATTTYVMEFDNRASAQASNKSNPSPQELGKTIQAHVDANAAVEGGRVLSGKGLYYGMKPAPRCMYLPGKHAMRPPVTTWQRLVNYLGFL